MSLHAVWPSRPLTPSRYDAGSGRWRALAGPEEPERDEPDELRIASWNVWFGERAQRERAESLLDLLEREAPDLIGLQEVTPAFLALTLARPWVRARYAISDARGGTVAPYGVLLLSRRPLAGLALQELPTAMGRSLLAARLARREGPLTVATVHLESMRGNGETRAEQLEVILPALAQGGSDALLCGDMNFAPTDALEQSRVGPDWEDLWARLSPADPGFTSDTTRNRMTFLHKGREKHARIDRFFLRSPARTWAPREIRLLGTEPISPEQPEVFPSDHFGLLARLERRAGRTEKDNG